jgi:DeoR family suf operon transcriptional repressor
MGSQTRELILRALRAQGKCTVKDLADAAHISPVSVRHHLASLQADGLIRAEEVKHGVGRPHHQFSLTDRGYEIFPTRYFHLTNRLLGELKESLPMADMQNIFSGVADTMAEDVARQLADLPVRERLERLVQLLNDEGFEAEFERRGDTVIIRELSCPYYQIGQNHPEVCMIDKTFIARALSLPVEQVNSLLAGDAHCAFSITLQTEEPHGR